MMNSSVLMICSSCCSAWSGCLQCRQTFNCQQNSTNARIAEHMWTYD